MCGFECLSTVYEYEYHTVNGRVHCEWNSEKRRAQETKVNVTGNVRIHTDDHDEFSFRRRPLFQRLTIRTAQPYVCTVNEFQNGDLFYFLFSFVCARASAFVLVLCEFV